MLCPKCGGIIPDDSKFCVHCGSKIEKVVTMRITNQPVANNAEQPKEMRCPGCGAVIEPGAKFCTKCGTKLAPQMQPIPQSQPVPQVQPIPQSQPVPQVQPVPQPQPVPQVQPTPQPQPSSEVQPVLVRKKEKSSKKNILIIIVILFLVIDIIAGASYFYMKSQGKDPLKMVAGLFGSDSEDKEEDKDRTEGSLDKESEEDNKESEEKSDEPQESSEQEEPEAVKGDISLLEPAKSLANQAKQQYEAQNYVDGISLSAEAMEQYISVAEENNLKEEAQEGIDNVYWIYVDSLMRYGDGMIAQGAYAAGYEQINDMLTEEMDLTTILMEKGYTVESQRLITYKDNLIQTYRDMFIKSINNITKYENWSRDEAWNYAEQAYSVKEDGKTVLFDEQNLDDPLRLRYEYSLAWVTRKRCEKGLADNSMTYADAVNSMVAILQETDYNLLLLQDIISYGTSAGMDVEKYRNAYNAIVDEIKTEQGLTVGNEINGSSSTGANLSHFWYFNDLDGEEKYKIDSYNGTKATTREWIRNNVPGLLNE